MDIKMSDNVNLYDAVRDVIKGGHILAVYSESDAIYAENLLRCLVREYRITKKVLPTNIDNDMSIVDDIMRCDDDVRLVISFGGNNMLECTKVATTMMGLGHIIVLTTPLMLRGESTYIFENGMLKLRSTVSPKCVLRDNANLARRAGIEYVLADMSECMLDAFDEVYKGVLGGKGVVEKDRLDNILHIMNSTDEGNRQAIIESTLNVKPPRESITSYIAYEMSRSSDSGRDAHSYKYGLAYTILLLYKGYIECDGDDLLYPPDIVDSARRISKMYDIDISPLVLGYKVMGASEYMRMRHITHEYREELLAMLDRCIATMEHVSRVYRRVSKDAGYAMYNDVSLDSLLESIGLFSICEGENTPIRLMKVGGYLERYIGIG